jgi:hypothetical protein
MTKIIVSLLAGVTGIATLLAGLGTDAWLHAQDETLAAREGIFALTNPGHLLLGAGLVLTCAGILMALYFAWGMSRAGFILGRRWVRLIGLQAMGAAAVGATVVSLAASAAGHDHAHIDSASAATSLQAHGESMAADMAASSGGVEALAIAQPDLAPRTYDDMASAMTRQTQGNAMTPGGDVAAAGAAPADDEMAMAHEPAGAGTMPVPAEASHRAAPSDGTMISDDAQMHADGMPARPRAPMPAGAHGRPEPTVGERACLVALTAEAKAATLRFADIEVARAEGYRISDDPTKTHMPNPAYSRDGKLLDLAYPETLVYRMDADGERQFVGALYKALKGAGPTPCGAATYWHTHGRCMPPAGEAIPENKDKTCPAGYTHREGAVEMMHLWFVPRRQR